MQACTLQVVYSLLVGWCYQRWIHVVHWLRILPFETLCSVVSVHMNSLRVHVINMALDNVCSTLFLFFVYLNTSYYSSIPATGRCVGFSTRSTCCALDTTLRVWSHSKNPVILVIFLKSVCASFFYFQSQSDVLTHPLRVILPADVDGDVLLDQDIGGLILNQAAWDARAWLLVDIQLHWVVF